MTSLHAPRLTGPRTGLYVIALVALVAAAAAIRAWSYLGAYALNIDELIYASLAISVPHEGIFPITFSGDRFLLHPPLVFFAGALVAPAVWLDGDPVGYAETVLGALRWVNVAAGAATVAVVAELVRRGAPRFGHTLALLAGALVALDPFIVRQNGHYYLETIAVLLILSGSLVLAGGLRRDELTWPRIIVGGLLLGLAVLAKDKSVVIVAVPLLAALVWGLRVPRWRWAATLGFAAVPYGAYLAAVAMSPYWDGFWAFKTNGITRVLGEEQTTGFNAPASPPLVDTLAEQVLTYWPTYLLLALAVPATLYLLIRGSSVQRFIGLIAAAAGALLGYALLFGTIEEHFLYYLLLPALVAVVSAVALLAQTAHDAPARAGRWVVAVFSVLVFGMAASGAWTQAQLRTVPDDAYQNAMAWLDDNAGSGDTIAWAQGKPDVATIDVFMLGNSRWEAGPWAERDDVEEYGVDYIVTLSKQIEEGYAYTDADFLTATLPAYAEPVFTQESRWAGTVQVWQVTDR